MKTIHPDIERIIIDEQTIDKRVSRLARLISSEYQNVEKLILIGILKGSFIFLADLSRKLTIPHTVDFMAISSYGDSTISSGEVRLVLDLREPIENEHVLIIEDIVDSGHTLQYLQKLLSGRNPTSLRTCSLLQKDRDSLEVDIDYLGFHIPDVWVVGYGLDYADRYRTLPYVAELRESVYTK